MAPLTWLITGASSGLGEKFVHSILARGDKVIATARNDISRLNALNQAGAAVYTLDVTHSQSEISSQIRTMIEETGGIDVLVNNAGYIEAGLIEAIGYDRYLAQSETNLFGAIKTTQAILPHLRTKHSGTIVFVGSSAGWEGDSGASPYCMTKFALEGFHESLRKEIAQFNIQSIIFEPGFIRTEIMQPDNIKTNFPETSDYDELRKHVQSFIAGMNRNQPGDPEKVVALMIDVVKGEGLAQGKAMPERLPIGPDALHSIRSKCIRSLAICQEWESAIVGTNFE